MGRRSFCRNPEETMRIISAPRLILVRATVFVLLLVTVRAWICKTIFNRGCSKENPWDVVNCACGVPRPMNQYSEYIWDKYNSTLNRARQLGFDENMEPFDEN